MPAGIQAEQLDIEHMGYPRYGMPVAHIESCKGPANTLPAKALLHHGIIENVFVCVVNNKRVPDHFPEYGAGDNNQQNADSELGANTKVPDMGCSVFIQINQSRRRLCFKKIGFDYTW